jgi:hypothetical protein
MLTRPGGAVASGLDKPVSLGAAEMAADKAPELPAPPPRPPRTRHLERPVSALKREEHVFSLRFFRRRHGAPRRAGLRVLAFEPQVRHCAIWFEAARGPAPARRAA